MVPKLDQLVAKARLAARDARNNLEHVPAWYLDRDKAATVLALNLADADLAAARKAIAAALAEVDATVDFSKKDSATQK